MSTVEISQITSNGTIRKRPRKIACKPKKDIQPTRRPCIKRRRRVSPVRVQTNKKLDRSRLEAQMERANVEPTNRVSIAKIGTDFEMAAVRGTVSIYESSSDDEDDDEYIARLEKELKKARQGKRRRQKRRYVWSNFGKVYFDPNNEAFKESDEESESESEEDEELEKKVENSYDSDRVGSVSSKMPDATAAQSRTRNTTIEARKH